ncbi:hypothetical protein A3K93_09055 [Acinetobacter sp. NCu2D-2]|uniref:DUF1853 family protein n=1 Tax=Acinetobacter sp. NCu2D-2 TaxID=1608473 RepID=UPI0007CDDD97|nr:DUF1853 family protein [Acinetobacter sp. NCu2D-2]ANF82323.1 hypothetical protein A3K93_09055 [Acinetobacter sp. NCu2D-2]
MPFSPLNTNLYEKWQNYQHPLVRQLAFAVGSPNILSQLPDELEIIHPFQLHDDQTWQKHLENYHPRLIELDQNPTELIEFVSRLKSTRLGLRFEMLVWFWLLDAKYHPYQLLGHSIQKIDGPKTLGELDFVLLNAETHQIEHWEVALKYYLAEADLSLANWYGLNRSDTLNRKLKHFTQKQFQFQEALGHHIQQRYCMIKGQLYLPQHQVLDNIPNWINPNRRIGCWGKQIFKPEQGYYRLQRHEWIYPEAQPSSQPATWWTDGLYKHQDHNDFYMFRQPHLIHI